MMSSVVQKQNNNSHLDFDQVLNQEGALFVESLTQALNLNSSINTWQSRLVGMSKSLGITADIIATVPFAGTAVGEFIVALSRTDAHSIFGAELSEADLADLIRETLNMAAGQRIFELSKVFSKLTITAPRVLSGSVLYPSIRNIHFELSPDLSQDGRRVHLYFYVDRMKLDIGESYKQVITDLERVNHELHQANENLKQQQAQLVHSEKMASLGVMAAGVAHEINNPLAFVLSNTEVLTNYTDSMGLLLHGYEQLLRLVSEGRSQEARSEFVKLSDLRKREDISFILDDTKKLLDESKYGLGRIRGIVNGLKRFSRVDESDKKIVQINEEIQNTLMLLHNELKYRCQVESDLRSTRDLECSPGEISQVLVNLLMNAAQSIEHDHGIVKIRSLDEGTDHVAIEVEDNGKGMSEDTLKKIFTPFFTTKPVGQGTGLGLSISINIVEKHGGTLTVKSKPQEGSCFRITLPTRSKAPCAQSS